MKAFVPVLTDWLLTQFAEDDRVFSEFVAGVHGMEFTWGEL